MKQHSQWARFRFALAGIASAWQAERSFRTEGYVFAGVLAFLAWRQPPLFWWMIVLISAGLVFMAELTNTAIEHVCDALHPDRHPLIGTAKDCASAAVLVANTLGFIVLAALLRQTF